MILRPIACSFALGLTACVTAPPPTASETLAASMEGIFETAIGTEDAMRDRRVRIDPLGPGEWLYYQVNHRSDLSVYRQRILQLESLPDGRVQQTAWTFNDAAAHVDLWDAPEVLASLTMGNLSTGLEQGCAQVWIREEDGWSGIVDPDTCLIDSQRRGTQIRIGAESRLSVQSLALAERGFDLDGDQLWGTDPGDFYRLDRVE